MKQLIYTSSASGGVAAKTLGKIMASAHRNNERSGVTGLLMYNDGSFIQILEGEARSVDETFSRIRADRRHLRVLKLAEREGQDRLFPDWSMALARPEDVPDADAQVLRPFGEVLGMLSALREVDPRVSQLLNAFAGGGNVAEAGTG